MLREGNKIQGVGCLDCPEPLHRAPEDWASAFAQGTFLSKQGFLSSNNATVTRWGNLAIKLQDSLLNIYSNLGQKE